MSVDLNKLSPQLVEEIKYWEARGYKTIDSTTVQLEATGERSVVYFFNGRLFMMINDENRKDIVTMREIVRLLKLCPELRAEVAKAIKYGDLQL